MLRTFFSQFFTAPAGGSTDVSLSFEGISWSTALLCFLVLGVAAFWGYRIGARELSRGRRILLASLRVLLIAGFLFLLVKPVLLLTLNEPVREKLLVLLDTTQSMEIKDRRRTEDDEKRAGLAVGLLNPAKGLDQDVSEGVKKWVDTSRSELLRALAANERLRLWPRLQEKADLFFYSAGREALPIGPISPASGSANSLSIQDAIAFFKPITYPVPVTALGDSLRQVLEDNRGQPVGGVLVISDGANNTGTPPEEIAELAKQDGLPLYLYGIGITEPKDIVVRDLTGPRGAFVKERAEFSVKVRTSGLVGRNVTLQLKANGQKVDEKKITVAADGEADYQLGFEPQEKGEAQLEAVITPLDDESADDNNSATSKVRVLDSKVKVLYIEQEPRWDFRYLLATLQRDRRLDVKCVLFDGGVELAEGGDPAVLKEFPAERSDLVENEIIIFGDVDPKELGETRMKLINEWVGEMGGGLIFLAGPKNNPFRYAGTPLEPLLPVELSTGLTPEQWAVRSRIPIRLKLTPTGELSPLLSLADTPLENRQVWNSFPGVRWTARVSRARPTAQVFLIDTRPELANRNDSMPVIAQQPYGLGMVMYFGFDETYRWRSGVGEKNYIRIWNQIMQSFSLERQLGASSRTQLKVEQPEYLAGDKVVISGKIYTQNFMPLIESSVPGILTHTPADGKGEVEQSEVRLLAVPDHPGEFQLEFTPKAPGDYRFSTLMDPKAVLKFVVIAPKIEQGDTAMNAPLLKAMAQISGGKFLREEDLDGLPQLISSHSATVPTFKKIELYHTAWWMLALMVIACLEWLLRRLWQLK
jgi:hypothetical protein